MSSGSSIPGFDAGQSFVIRTVAREAAREAVAELAGQHCPFDCQDVKDLKKTVYGNGDRGLKMRMTTLEGQVADLLWWNRAALGAAVASFVSLIIQSWRS